ncbi:MAG: IS200/IS605 family accessory protein TnpB-related protein, partial [Gemmataceae bacterium]|nr:IS200/IS605 family accessory protein TnpB-related protein [Gemmataceae bacterium]
MKLVVQIQLLPDHDQSALLKATVERTNEASNWVAGVAFENKTSNIFDLRRLCYHEVRDRFSLSSQQAQLAIKAVADVYKRDKAIRVTFRKHGAIAYDQRTMGFKGINRVSLLTLSGRTVVPFILGQYQESRIGMAHGQCKLLLRGDGRWFLIVTIDVPDGSPIPTTDFVGVDFGVKELASDSDGTRYSGNQVEDIRRKHNLQRKRLQRRGTKGAKKKLRRIAGKEARFRKYQDHVISKRIVETAKGTGRGVAVEELTHIRDRITARGGEARNRLGGWAFAQLRSFIAYKCRLAGVPLVAEKARVHHGQAQERWLQRHNGFAHRHQKARV